MDKEKSQALIVDRERIAGLISKMLAGKFALDTATDGVKAINKLRDGLPRLMVVDVDVPGNGVRLAELVGISPKYRGIPVILTAANPSPDLVLRARNAGASSLLVKPFGPAELLKRVDAALTGATMASPAPPKTAAKDGETKDDAADPAEAEKEEEEEDPAASLKERVKSIEGLPSFPTTHAQILELANSEKTSSDEIAEKIELDPGLLATVFKLVNSSYYGFNKKIDSISLAVTLLGLEEIANLVMAAQVFEKLGDYEEGGGLDLMAFWRHSVGTGFISRAIAKKLQAESDSAFLAGMLHDLGKIILDRYFSDYYASVFSIIQAEDKLIVEVEQDVLGVSHAEIGGVLAEEWKFAPTYLNSILCHHNVRQARRYQRLVCIVSLANTMCRRLEFGSSGDNQKPDFEGASLERFSLGEKGVQMLTEAAQEELENADSFLSALTT